MGATILTEKEEGETLDPTDLPFNWNYLWLVTRGSHLGFAEVI